MKEQNPKSRANLIPVTKRTKSEARRMSSKGGKASGKARAAMKTLKEGLQENLTNEDIKIISERIITMAKHGNLKAYQLLRDGLGEKPTDKVEVSGTLDIGDAFAAAVRRRDERRAKEREEQERLSCQEEQTPTA